MKGKGYISGMYFDDEWRVVSSFQIRKDDAEKALNPTNICICNNINLLQELMVKNTDRKIVVYQYSKWLFSDTETAIVSQLQ